MIHVIATIELRPHTRADFLREFSRLRPKVLAEDGCLEYGAAVDVDSGLGAQGVVRRDAVVIVEKWSSLDALRAHLKAPHMGPYRDAVKGFVVKTALQVLEPAD